MLDEERLGLKVVQTWQKEINRMGNLEPRWTGPYKVTECLTKGRVKLENITSGKLLKNTYHSANLKVFIPRSSTSSSPSSPTSASDCTPNSLLVDITTGFNFSPASPCKRKASLESLQPDKRPKTV